MALEHLYQLRKNSLKVIKKKNSLLSFVLNIMLVIKVKIYKVLLE